jgi:hypothetical protein
MTTIHRETFLAIFQHCIENFLPHEHYISWIHHQNDFGSMTNDIMKKQIKIWKDLKVECLRYNFRDYEINGKKLYYFVILPKDTEEVPFCPIGLFLPDKDNNSIMVSGYGYLATSSKNRDMIWKYLL